MTVKINLVLLVCFSFAACKGSKKASETIVKSTTVLWQQTDSSKTVLVTPVENLPKAYACYTLNYCLFSSLTQNISDSSLMLFPVGKEPLSNFKITQTHVMAPELEKKFPQLKTFAGTSVNDNHITIRFEQNGESINGLINKRGEIYVIKPFQTRNGSIVYLSFNKKDLIIEREVPFENSKPR